MNKLNAIFAIDQLGGIGKNGSLPWPNNSKDLQYFKTKTLGHTVIMGRKTWDDSLMPKPLPGRTNVVLTHRDIHHPIPYPGVVCYDNLEKAITWYLIKSEVWVIGGSNVLLQLAGRYDLILVTVFHENYNCDTFINLSDLKIDKYNKTVVGVGSNFTRFEYENIH